MPKIKHIALTTTDVEKVAGFWKEVFDMEEVGRSGGTHIYLSDGEMNLTIRKVKAADDADVGAQGADFCGIHHIGFTVEDIPNFVKRAEKAGGIRLTSQPAPGVEAPARGHSNADVKFSGPDGVIFDMSQYGWIGNKPHYRPVSSIITGLSVSFGSGKPVLIPD